MALAEAVPPGPEGGPEFPCRHMKGVRSPAQDARVNVILREVDRVSASVWNRRSVFGSALLLAAIVVTSAPAQASSCIQTSNDCSSTATVTTSLIKIGGDGSLGSKGVLNNHGILSDQTAAEATYQFTFDRSTGRLTLVAKNTTSGQSVLTGILFNAPPSVTGVTLLSNTGPLVWAAAFDHVRGDGIVDSFPFLPYLRGGSFGIFNVFVGNSQQISTDVGAGQPDTEIVAGDTVTFVFQIDGDLSGVTACSFTSLGSIIPPGDKIVNAVGRFQGGIQGGIGFISPCEGGSLLVTMGNFMLSPADSQVTLLWDTATEVDNVGFRILRTDVRAKQTVALNTNLIPAQGGPTFGASYGFVDKTAVNGRRYVYYVEDWDVTERNTIHRGLDAIPNPLGSKVRLVAPAYDADAGRTPTFKWVTTGRMLSTLEISADASFPEGATLRLRTGARSARSLSAKEIAQVTAMSAAGEGGLYWRVVSRDARKSSDVSPTFFARVTN